MPPRDDDQSLTLDLLRRAHSPDSVNRIYSDKIQHRPLFLKPSSPPPSTARDARRIARRAKEKRAKALKPKPLSARERRRLQLYTLPKEGRTYAVFAPLNNLWVGYIREILGSELYNAGQGAAAKLSAADFHGAEVEVSRSRCPSRVGVRGIVVKDTRFTFEVITRQNQVKTLPKEGTIFRVHVPAPDAAPDHKPFCFEIHGDQFQHRASDRANKKLKQHFLKKL
ncbi:RNase P/MRP, p29 subunit [Xylaria bambusicola]|uniref:RNase P/MRP, p29 subunit n=1 Tax=Xylaria bambusicola TaxID=326684 RepID=UPI0020085978|nr:RNase P/MRP, p29 subunit [Xylaria bambusicola]KAI0508694.1 RNase P/MRP, p29 subunit [Xylaria bambusicola]